MSRKVLTILVFSAATLLGCTGGGGKDDATPTVAPTPTPEGTTITSEDGNLSLFIPDGAVPEGTDVSITDVPSNELPPELQELVGFGNGYRLEPDGLTFATPARATLTIDRSELDVAEDEMPAYVFSSFSAAAGREVLATETRYTMGEPKVTLSGEITHLSSLSRSKASLSASLEAVRYHQPLHGSINANAYVWNLNPQQVLLDDVRAANRYSGAVGENLAYAIAQPAQFGVILNEASPVEGYVVHASCDRLGLGAYGVTATATAHPVDFENISTMLTLKVDSLVDCVEQGSELLQTPTSEWRDVTQTPIPTPTGADVGLAVACEHRGPGDSVLIVRLRPRDEDGAQLGRVSIVLEIEGPDGYFEEDNVFIGRSGEETVEYRISRTGKYTVRIVAAGLEDGTPLERIRSSLLPAEFTVGEVCTPLP